MTVPRVGVDVGGTSMRARLFAGPDSTRLEAPTELAGGPTLVDQIAALVGSLVSDAGAAPSHVGVGIPGQVDPVAGTVRHAVNLGLDGTPLPLGAMLEDRLGLPVAIENDVRTAALGAFHLLSAEDPELRDLVYLSLGTGVSAGVVIDRRLHRGRHGLAGEIGHAPLGPDDAACRCGLTGCLEAVAGGRSLDDRHPDRARRLFTEDTPDRQEAERVAATVARAIYVLATAYDPDRFVLGGGMGLDALPAVRRALEALASSSSLGPSVLTPDRVEALSPDADAGTTGAALLGLDTDVSGMPEQPQGGNPP